MTFGAVGGNADLAACGGGFGLKVVGHNEPNPTGVLVSDITSDWFNFATCGDNSCHNFGRVILVDGIPPPSLTDPVDPDPAGRFTAMGFTVFAGKIGAALSSSMLVTESVGTWCGDGTRCGPTTTATTSQYHDITGTIKGDGRVLHVGTTPWPTFDPPPPGGGQRSGIVINASVFTGGGAFDVSLADESGPYDPYGDTPLSGGSSGDFGNCADLCGTTSTSSELVPGGIRRVAMLFDASCTEAASGGGARGDCAAGPYAAGTCGGGIWRWTGSEWRCYPLLRWDGAQWAQVSRITRWDGSQFADCGCTSGASR